MLLAQCLPSFQDICVIQSQFLPLILYHYISINMLSHLNKSVNNYPPRRSFNNNNAVLKILPESSNDLLHNKKSFLTCFQDPGNTFSTVISVTELLQDLTH